MIPLLLQTAPTLLEMDAEFTKVIPCGHAVSEKLARRMRLVGLPTNEMLGEEGFEGGDWADCLVGGKRRCWFCGEGFLPEEVQSLYFDVRLE
jgi:hypothetical protein